MILKDINIEFHKSQIRTLDDLLKRSKSRNQQALIKIEKSKIENGYKTEKDHAYYINFKLKDSKNCIVLHDIRLIHNGNVAQFDHILISRLDIIILESKSFSEGAVLEIKDNGSLEVKRGEKLTTYPSPIEQNKRHQHILKSFLKDKFEFSKRVQSFGGFPINYKVLISPETNIINKKIPDGFVRGDVFISQRYEEELNAEIFTFKPFKELYKIISRETIKDIANLLIDNNKPLLFDYTKKFRVAAKNKAEKRQNINNKETESCPRCKQGCLILKKSNKKPEKYKSNEFYACNQYPKCRFTRQI